MARLDPKPLSDLIAEGQFATLISAIRTELESVFVGVDISAHIGKLDVADILAADIKRLPAIYIGWTRAVPVRSPADHYTLEIDFAAYIAVQDFVDLAGKRKVGRAEVAQALGVQLLRLLNHDDHNHFGMEGFTRPATDRAIEFKPVFTASSYAKGIAYYAVTWTQSLIDQGRSIATDYGQAFDLGEEGGISSDDPEFANSVEVLAIMGSDFTGGGDD
jgi:phage gp37-like protein